MSKQGQNPSLIAVTLGEPAGIGADIFLQYAQSNVLDDLVVIGDQRALAARADRIGVAVPNVALEHCPVAQPEVCGKPEIRNADGVMAMLDHTIDGCLSNRYAAMVTGPLSKSVIADSGRAFSGHTEYLAERCEVEQAVMLLATSSLKVALVTTHLPLSEVSAAITSQKLHDVISILDHDMRTKFGIQSPRILVCGLNPHAGEGGHLGREEIDIIAPEIKQLQSAGLNLVGPVSADTAFTTNALQGVDVVLAMYHDQGLPVLKAQGFGDAANITLGLPIVRSSVDHGTAFEMAGSGKTDFGGLATAIEMARAMVASQRLEKVDG